MDDGAAHQTAYKQITQHELTADGLKRIIKIKETLNISDNDALWNVVYILEMYIRIIEDYNIRMKSAVWEAIKKYAESGGVINFFSGEERDKGISVERLMFWLGAMLFICMMAFISGIYVASAASPPAWFLNENKAHNIFSIFLAMPAGWLFFILLTIPAIFYTFENRHFLRLDGKEKYVAIIKVGGGIIFIIIGLAIFAGTFINR